MTVSILGGVLDVIYPPSCAACDRIGPEPFCRTCADAVLPAEPFSIAGADRAVAVYAFGGPVADAIHHLKYHDRPELGRTLGRAMRPALESLGTFDVVVPMPISPRRLRERGYCQVRELLRGLALAPAIDVLHRVREPETQVGLDRAARAKNLAGAFAPGPTSVASQRVLLVDDVVTTGATAEVATGVLREAKAAEVLVLALAHTS